MRRYRIAVFTVDWNCELVENTMRGLKQFVLDHENVQICVFDCFGKETETARSRTEYRIFDLADLEQFDGLLIQGNQIVLKEEKDRIGRRVAQSGIPAVAIDSPIEGCVLIGLDNRSSQHDITQHVIRVHGARRLVYLTGLLHNGSPNGQLRVEGFLDACRENGLTSSDVEIVEGSWKTEDGMRTADKWVQDRKMLPDAFICANDEMALGMIEAFAMHGIKVPQDVIITGFDNVSAAMLSDPQLTTVNRDFDDASYSAMQLLLEMIDRKRNVGGNRFKGEYDEEPCTQKLQYQVVCSESCGCRAAVKAQDVKRLYFHRSRFLKNFHMQQAGFSERLLDVPDLPRLMVLVGEHQEVFGCGRVCLCVNDYYFDHYDQESFCHNTETFGEMMVTARRKEERRKEKGPKEERYQDAGGQDHPEIVYERFPSKNLLPDRMMEEERFLVFYPIHYNTRSIGYLAMNGMSDAAVLNLHENMFSFLEIAVENVRKRGLLRHLNEQLDHLYVMDRLTGLFNRFGFERFALVTYEEFLKREGGAQIIFVDMDQLKMINDRYGHEMGDEAIRESAEALQSVCRPEDFVMRYGGDEFLVITSAGREGFEADLEDALRQKNETGSRPFALSMSVGIIPTTDHASQESLEGLIQEADALMYENKKAKKAFTHKSLIDRS